MTYKIRTFPSPGQVARLRNSNKRVDDFSFDVRDGLDIEVAGGSGYLVERDALHAALSALRSF